MANASRDENRVPTLLGIDSISFVTPTTVAVDPVTHEMLVQTSGTISVVGPVTVTATDLDIRNLSQNQDSVLIYGSDDGGTTKRVIKTDSGGAIQVDLEVSSVTVTNGSGASAVNIQDGGNTITVDGTVTTTESTPTTVFTGKTIVTTAGTRVPLSSSQTIKSVTVKALNSNTGLIYVGNSSVTNSNGYIIYAGEAISLDISNLNTINVDSSVSSEGVTYIAIN